MRKGILLAVGVGLLLLPLACNDRQGAGTSSSTPSLVIRTATVTVEIADTPALRTQGLSGRASLGAAAGMLFVFDVDGRPSFWMKEMKFPLDFIWLRDAVVVGIHENLPSPEASTPDSALPTYTPSIPVDSMLEVNAGFVKQYGIQAGDSVALNLGR